jgi:hypothetical protein
MTNHGTEKFRFFFPLSALQARSEMNTFGSTNTNSILLILILTAFGLLRTVDFINRNNCWFSFSLLQKAKSFTRVVDGSFFSEEPLELLSQKTLKIVPSIIGVNNQECGYILPVVRILAALPASASIARQLFASIDDSLCDKSWEPIGIYATITFPLTGRGVIVCLRGGDLFGL